MKKVDIFHIRNNEIAQHIRFTFYKNAYAEKHAQKELLMNPIAINLRTQRNLFFISLITTFQEGKIITLLHKGFIHDACQNLSTKFYIKAKKMGCI